VRACSSGASCAGGPRPRGLVLAAHGAVALAGAQKHDQLRPSAETQDLIGQAKGILVERHQVRAHQVFAVLMKVSSDTRCKLRDIADELTTTGELPGSTDRRARRPS
jgi:hypothetical protein